MRGVERPSPEPVAAAFAREQLRLLELATRTRLVGLAILAVWVPLEDELPGSIFYLGVLALLTVSGVLPLALRRRGVSAAWPSYVFPLLDVAVVAVALFVPNPFEAATYPLPLRLRFGGEIYFFVILAASVLAYSPHVVLWTGFVTAVAWSAGTAWIFSQPDSLGPVGPDALRNLSAAARLQVFNDPHRVHLEPWLRGIVIVAVVTLTLAAAVWRSRRLVLGQVEAERQRGNLSRYFSPSLVEELARSDAGLRATKVQPAAVLFVDLVGFTAYGATRSPDDVVSLLRDFHRRMVTLVFAHGGTLNKFLGDGLMATFGAPRVGTADATDALRCACAMLRSQREWEAERTGRGEPRLGIGLGLHYGPVVLGNLGSEEQLEFAVLGDTVNVASRLQDLTRAMGVPLLASDDLVTAVQTEGQLGQPETAGLRRLPAQPIRGREGALVVWTVDAGGLVTGGG